MRCKSCVSKIQNEIESLYGVVQMVINLEASSGFVIHSELILPKTIQKQIQNLNFKSEISRTEQETDFKIPKTENVKSTVSSVSYKKENDQITINTPPSGETEKCIIQIVGMTCASCVNNIEKNISKENGVFSILVSLMSARGKV